MLALLHSLKVSPNAFWYDWECPWWTCYNGISKGLADFMACIFSELLQSQLWMAKNWTYGILQHSSPLHIIRQKAVDLALLASPRLWHRTSLTLRTSEKLVIKLTLPEMSEGKSFLHFLTYSKLCTYHMIPCLCESVSLFSSSAGADSDFCMPYLHRWPRNSELCGYIPGEAQRKRNKQKMFGAFISDLTSNRPISFISALFALLFVSSAPHHNEEYDFSRCKSNRATGGLLSIVSNR